MTKNLGIARERVRVAGHRNDDGHGAFAELARLRFGALPRRIEHHRVEILKFGCHERAPEQIARLRIDGLEATRFAGCLLQGFDRGGLAVGGRNPRAFSQTKSKRADPREKIGDVPGLAGMLGHEARQGFFAFGGRLEECTRRQRHVGTPDAQQGCVRCATSSPWRVSRASLCVSATFASAVSRSAGDRS